MAQKSICIQGIIFADQNFKTNISVLVQDSWIDQNGQEKLQSMSRLRKFDSVLKFWYFGQYPHII